MRVTMGVSTSSFMGRNAASLKRSATVMFWVRTLRMSGFPVSLRRRAAFRSRMMGAKVSLRVKNEMTAMTAPYEGMVCLARWMWDRGLKKVG